MKRLLVGSFVGALLALFTVAGWGLTPAQAVADSSGGGNGIGGRSDFTAWEQELMDQDNSLVPLPEGLSDEYEEAEGLDYSNFPLSRLVDEGEVDPEMADMLMQAGYEADAGGSSSSSIGSAEWSAAHPQYEAEETSFEDRYGMSAWEMSGYDSEADYLAALETAGEGALADTSTMGATGAAEMAAAEGVPETAAAACTNPAGVVVCGFAAGFLATTAGVSAYFKGTGQDQALCTGTSADKLINLVYSQDCALPNAIPKADQDVDATPGTIYSGSACAPSTNECVSITKLLANVVAKWPGVTNTYASGFCASVTPGGQSAGTGTGIAVVYTDAANSSGIGTPINATTPGGAGTLYDASGQRAVSGTPCGDPSTGTVGLALTNDQVTGIVGLEVQKTGAITPVTATQTSGDPQRVFTTTITGADGNTYTCESPAFTETVANFPSYCAPDVPATVPREQYTVTEHTVDGSAPDKTVVSQTPTPAYAAAATAYADCANGACAAQVYYQGAPCTVGESDCLDWETKAEQSPGEYECEYGPQGAPTEYNPPLGQCSTLTNFYDPDAQTEGKAYADPATGSAVDSGTSPDQDSQLMNQPGDQENPDGSNSDCFPSGTGAFNPINWVLQPIQCALRWAFVPKAADVEADVEDVQESWAATPPAELITAVSAWQLQMPGDGCSGITFPTTFLDPKGSLGIPASETIMQACAGDMLAPVAQWSKIFGTLGFVVGGAVAIMRIVGAVISFNPGGS